MSAINFSYNCCSYEQEVICWTRGSVAPSQFNCYAITSIMGHKRLHMCEFAICYMILTKQTEHINSVQRMSIQTAQSTLYKECP